MKRTVLALCTILSCACGASTSSNATAADTTSLSQGTKENIESVVTKAVALSAKKQNKLSHDDKPIVIKHGSFNSKFPAQEQPTPSSEGVIRGSLLKENLSIYPHRNTVDISELLENGYSALMSGQTEVATTLYKQVLAHDKNNNAALFGLATIYQRNGENSKAQKIYTTLLSQSPSNQDALNNFLMIAAEESPEGALIELKKLEAINPEFSPIAAQIGMIYAKMGKAEKAIRSLNRALLLSPDNQTYRYNLAILYDRAGKKDQAIAFYKTLLEADRHGATLPGSAEKIKERIITLSAS